ILGHETVAEAIQDPQVRRWVDEWWDAAARHLPLPETDVTAYRKALRERYDNPNIKHLLAQIAADGSQKIPIRAVPVIRAGLASGDVSPGALRLVSAWIAHLRGAGAPVTDPQSDTLAELVSGTVETAVDRVLDRLDLGADILREVVAAQV